MSRQDAKRTLRDMGKTIANNTPGPQQLAQGFREAVGPVLPLWALVAILLLFGEPFVRWLVQP